MGFCSEKVEDYKFNIIWESPKKPEPVDSVRGGSALSGTSLKTDNLALSPQLSTTNDACQFKAINELCQSVAISVKFNPSWNSVNKRSWCQQATSYFRCLKSRLDKCPEQDVQSQFQQLERYLYSQININCPGGVDGCTRHSTDARCKIGITQYNSSSSTFCLAYFVVQSVLQILMLF